MRTVDWVDGRVKMIDQTLLPHELKYLLFDDYRDVAEAIKTMRVRGAPAIGVAAALGFALAATRSMAGTTGELLAELKGVAELFAATRPTAVNLFWALARMMKTASNESNKSVQEMQQAITDEAIAILEEDIDRNQSLGQFG